ncbi:TPA: hypothetical protein N0F65_010073, partial [Lagenidium giganteum]
MQSIESKWGKVKDLLGPKVTIDEAIATLAMLQNWCEEEYVTKLGRIGTRVPPQEDQGSVELRRLFSTISVHAYKKTSAEYRAADESKYRIRDLRETYTVSLSDFACTCWFYSTMLLPCRHVYVVRRHLKFETVVPFVHIHERWMLQSHANDITDGEMRETSSFNVTSEVMSANDPELFSGMQASLMKFADFVSAGRVPSVHDVCASDSAEQQKDAEEKAAEQQTDAEEKAAVQVVPDVVADRNDRADDATAVQAVGEDILTVCLHADVALGSALNELPELTISKSSQDALGIVVDLFDRVRKCCAWLEDQSLEDQKFPVTTAQSPLDDEISVPTTTVVSNLNYLPLKASSIYPELLYGSEILALASSGWLNTPCIQAVTIHLARQLPHVGFVNPFFDSITDPAHRQRHARSFEAFDKGATKIGAVVNVGNWHWTSMFADKAAKKVYLYDAMENDESYVKMKAVACEVLATNVDWIDSCSYESETPKMQTDSHNCGVFALLYLECKSRGIAMDSELAASILYFR